MLSAVGMESANGHMQADSFLSCNYSCYYKIKKNQTFDRMGFLPLLDQYELLPDSFFCTLESLSTYWLCSVLSVVIMNKSLGTFSCLISLYSFVYIFAIHECIV